MTRGRPVPYTAPPLRRETAIAWTATATLALYGWWIGGVGYYYLPNLARARDGLGVPPGPVLESFLGEHSWVFAAVFVLFGAALIVKESLIRDKRLSVMITCLIAVLLLLVVDVTKLFLVAPVYRLISGVT